MAPRLGAISPDATTEEVAAIAAALALTMPRPIAIPSLGDERSRSRWVAAARRSARGSGLARGEWRLSGRIDRRSRV